MRRWPLKIKTGAYAALLTMLTLMVTAVFFFTILYYRQRKEVDDELRDNADELVRDLRNFRGAPVNPPACRPRPAGPRHGRALA